MAVAPVSVLLMLCAFLPISHQSQILHCGNNMFCFQKVQRSYLEWRDTAKELENIQRLVVEMGGEGFISNTTAHLRLLQKKERLCRDDLIAGFLLDDETGNTTNSCVWTGSELAVACMPVPPQYQKEPFHYILQPQWRTKVLIEELYICNERCIQGGIGYFASLLMLVCLSIAFIKNCLM